MAGLSLSDGQAEQLLTADDTVDAELKDVAEILRAVRDEALPDPGSDFSQLFSVAARESRLTPIEKFANDQIVITDDWSPRVVQRVVIAGAALFAIVAMSSGLAYAANGAKPGDLLYGLDRAIEAIGIGDGGATERLAEAQALVALGDVPMGLTHAVEVIADTPAGQAAAPAIGAAANRLENGLIDPESRTAVQNLLAYIHGALEAEDGKVDGQTVAWWAHLIGGRPDDPGNSENAPGRDPAGPPGQQDEDPGNSENAPGRDPAGPPGQQDEDPGNSENAPGRDPDGPPGQQQDPDPSNSDEAPGQGGENPGKGPSGGGPPGQGDG